MDMEKGGYAKRDSFLWLYHEEGIPHHSEFGLYSVQVQQETPTIGILSDLAEAVL